MSIKNRKSLQIGWSTLVCLALFVRVGWAGAPKAETASVPSRAVQAVNFTAFAQFRLARENRPLGLDTETWKEGLFGGWVTIPLGNHFGIRLALDGGIDAVSPEKGRRSFSLLNTGGDLFIRNPSKGYVQLGYRWNGSWWNSQGESQTSDFASSEHQLSYEMGLFLGDYDLDFGIEYLRVSGEGTATLLPNGGFQNSYSLPSNGFRLWGESHWYAANSLSLSFDAEWGRRGVAISPDDSLNAHLERFRARLSAYWQPPFASLVSGATVGLSVGLGYDTKPAVHGSMILPPGSDVSPTENTLKNAYSFTYGFRLGVTVYFPGTSSLKERARQHQ
ncbi:MAG: hypothetical protein CMN75_01295 [Spirochaeta sp.]|nr:hypothetical protein [Spirochaeta sp.]RPG03085.1 MAG: hypothetical protein CBC32_016565 [Proteobacteria bacterium TMED72]